MQQVILWLFVEALYTSDAVRCAFLIANEGLLGLFTAKETEAQRGRPGLLDAGLTP